MTAQFVTVTRLGRTVLRCGKCNGPVGADLERTVCMWCGQSVDHSTAAERRFVVELANEKYPRSPARMRRSGPRKVAT
jgi:hypothetical protein